MLEKLSDTDALWKTLDEESELKKNNRKLRPLPKISSSYVRKREPSDIASKLAQKEKKATENRERVLAKKLESIARHERHSNAVRERRLAATKLVEEQQGSQESLHFSFGGESQSTLSVQNSRISLDKVE